MQIDQPQRPLVCSAPSKEVWSSVADRLLVAQSAVLFPSASESHCDAISTEARASFQSDTVHTWSEIQFTLERACTIEEAAMTVEQGVDICTNRETGKEYLFKTLAIAVILTFPSFPYQAPRRIIFGLCILKHPSVCPGQFFASFVFPLIPTLTPFFL